MVSEGSPYLLSSPCCSMLPSHFFMRTSSASADEGFSGVAVVVVAASTRVNNARAAVEEEDVVVFMGVGMGGTRESGASHTDEQVTALRFVWFLGGAMGLSLRFLLFPLLAFCFLLLHILVSFLTAPRGSAPPAVLSFATCPANLKKKEKAQDRGKKKCQGN